MGQAMNLYETDLKRRVDDRDMSELCQGLPPWRYCCFPSSYCCHLVSTDHGHKCMRFNTWLP